MTNWNFRPNKQKTRSLATQFAGKEHALFFPANNAYCLKTAINNKMINENTHITLIERNKIVSSELQNNLLQMQLPNPIVLHQTDLARVNLTSPLDYAWFDLNGIIKEDIAKWIQHHLNRNLKPNAVLCLTHAYCWRGNPWLVQMHKEFQTSTEFFQFRNKWILFGDYYVDFVPFLFDCLLPNWNLILLDKPFRYHDTIDMVFYQFAVEEYKPLKEREIEVMTTSKEVIEAIVKARFHKSPAHKAHATRKKEAYAKQQEQLGKNPKLCLAAIEAHATRILQRM